MSRSGYSDDFDNWDLIRWRGIITSATRGRRGQRFFRSLVTALDAMPEKRLASGFVSSRDGVCALGALGRHAGKDLEQLDRAANDWDFETLGGAFDIAEQLAQEVMYENDERYDATPEARWQRMRDWAEEQIEDARSEGGADG